MYTEGGETETFKEGIANGAAEKGGGVGGSGGGGLADPPGEECEVLEYLESGIEREEANDGELLFKAERYSDWTCKKRRVEQLHKCR